MVDLSAILDEYSALGIDKADLLAMYKIATTEQFSFLYVNLLARDMDSMFFKRFEARLVPGGSGRQTESDGMSRQTENDKMKYTALTGPGSAQA